jgi:hypothetical protein
MPLTYKNLQDRCLTYGYGEVDRNNFKTWLNEGYEDLVRQYKWPFLQATASIATVAGTSTVAIPTSPPVLFFGRLKPANDDTPALRYLNEMDFREYMPNREYDSGTGEPEYYSLFAGSMHFYPTPAAVYTYSLRYWRGLSTLPSADGDTYLIPDAYLDALVVFALSRAAMRETDMGKYQVYVAQYQALLAQMMRNYKAEQQETVRRVAMPNTYGGAYDRE